MKKSLLFLVSLALGLSAFSQNLQLHFDGRKGLHSADAPFYRNYITATFEMYKPDKWGSTFMFVDLDFNQSRGNIGSAYMEIARDQNLGSLPIKAHVEFNGGLASWGTIPNAYLVGPSYGTMVNGWILGTYLVYKYQAFERVSNDVQWTATWSKSLFNNKFTMSGFIDVWTQNKVKEHFVEVDGKMIKATKRKKVVLITEPQFWYNVDSHLSFGTEIEITNNFYNSKTYVNPTIAAKWNF